MTRTPWAEAHAVGGPTASAADPEPTSPARRFRARAIAKSTRVCADPGAVVRGGRTLAPRVMRWSTASSPRIAGRKRDVVLRAADVDESSLSKRCRVKSGTDGVRGDHRRRRLEAWRASRPCGHLNADVRGLKNACKVVSRFGRGARTHRAKRHIGGSTAVDGRTTSPVGWRCAMDHGSQYLSEPLPQSACGTFGDAPQLRLRRGTGNERGGRALESYAQGATDSRPHLSKSRRRTGSSACVRPGRALQHAPGALREAPGIGPAIAGTRQAGELRQAA